MGIKVLMSLDLERGVGEEARRRFYEYLAAKYWTKVPRVTTCWRVSFVDGASEAGVVRAVQDHLAEAAKYAPVRSYNAVWQLGGGEPATVSV